MFEIDIWDPNTWTVEQPECRIYTDAKLSEWVIVDYEDYAWAVQWCWHLNKPHPKRTGTKRYARRSIHTYSKNTNVYQPPLYLHVEIMKRTGIEPPSPLHTLVDHINGNELDCRRKNLRWATPSMNTKNSRRKAPLLERVS